VRFKAQGGARPSSGAATLDMMAFVEKEFGKNITTRNWNTVGKILKG